MIDHIDWRIGIGKTNALLSHLDDRKHIVYYQANSALQGYLW
jgi:hypothetical protein